MNTVLPSGSMAALVGSRGKYVGQAHRSATASNRAGGNSKSWQQRGLIGLLVGDNEVTRLFGRVAKDDHGPMESVDDPVLDDAGLLVFEAFLDVISTPIPAGCGNEFDDDRWDVDCRVGSTAQADPDHAIGPSPSVRRADIAFRQRGVQDGALGVLVKKVNGDSG